MGRASLFLVLGLSLAFGIIGFSMRRTTNSLVEAQTGYSKYLFARNLARTAVHTTLRAFDRNLTPIPEAGSFNGGSYTVQYHELGDTLWLRSTGMYAESTYTMRVKLLRTTKPFPRIGAAIGIRATPVNFLIAGHAEVDGRNYDSTGAKLLGYGDVPGVATMTKTDSATVAKEEDEIEGVPPIKVDTSTIDPLPFLNEYKSNADYVYNISGVYSGSMKWGTQANPVVVYCNAGDDTTFSIKFTGDVVGYGILVVRGNVQFNGSINFKGLVVVDGFNTVVQFGAAGTPQIVGGVIIAGNAGASVTLKGTGADAKVKYSADALDKARRIGKLRYYSIIEWYE